MSFLFTYIDPRTVEFFSETESWLVGSNFRRASHMQGYVGRCSTVRNLKLFFAYTLSMNYVITMFLLASCSNRSKQVLCFAHGHGQTSEQKPETGFVTIPRYWLPLGLLHLTRTEHCRLISKTFQFPSDAALPNVCSRRRAWSEWIHGTNIVHSSSTTKLLAQPRLSCLFEHNAWERKSGGISTRDQAKYERPVFQKSELIGNVID